VKDLPENKSKKENENLNESDWNASMHADDAPKGFKKKDAGVVG
jgi:hypothetical protein